MKTSFSNIIFQIFYIFISTKCTCITVAQEEIFQVRYFFVTIEDKIYKAISKTQAKLDRNWINLIAISKLDINFNADTLRRIIINKILDTRFLFKSFQNGKNFLVKIIQNYCIFDGDSYGSICFTVLLIYQRRLYKKRTEHKNDLVKNLKADISLV